MVPALGIRTHELISATIGQESGREARFMEEGPVEAIPQLAVGSRTFLSSFRGMRRFKTWRWQ